MVFAFACVPGSLLEFPAVKNLAPKRKADWKMSKKW
jgi:hypothetical protein